MRDPFSGGQPLNVIAGKVNTADNSAVSRFDRGRDEAREAARFGERVMGRIMRIRVGVNAEWDVVGAKKLRQRHRRGHAESAVARDIALKWWTRPKRLPRRIIPPPRPGKRIAVSGRQKSLSFFTHQATVPASAKDAPTVAPRRAVSISVMPVPAASVPINSPQGRGGFAAPPVSAQNADISSSSWVWPQPLQPCVLTKSRSLRYWVDS